VLKHPLQIQAVYSTHVSLYTGCFRKSFTTLKGYTNLYIHKICLDTFQQFLIPRLGEDDQEGRTHFQQDGDSMATSFPGFYTPRYLDFFLWGFVKDRLIVPPLSANVVELRTRIIAAFAEVAPEMLRRVWQEID
jgi:hypothetical protein